MKQPGAHSVRTIAGVMTVVVIAGVIIAQRYYSRANRSVDPRIVPARELYSGYDRVAQSGDFYSLFVLLDSIEEIYLRTEHYCSSFEIGVIENNRAAALLTLALYSDSIPRANNPFFGMEKDSIVSLARVHALSALRTYENWNREFGGKSAQEIRVSIAPGFLNGFESGDPAQTALYLSNRVREIETALEENKRRLSVCHTNLGVIYRHMGAYTDSVTEYEKALSLWDRNLEAENNLNRLLGKPVRKRNILQKLFPPDRGT
jgi:tetratricopeptide (TPR) repeat protein